MTPKQHCFWKEGEEDVLCSSCRLKLFGVWSSSQRMALSMVAGMTAWSWGPQLEQAEGLRSLSSSCGCHLSIKCKEKEIGGLRKGETHCPSSLVCSGAGGMAGPSTHRLVTLLLGALSEP